MNKFILFGTYTLNMEQSVSVWYGVKMPAWGRVITNAKIKLWIDWR